MKIRLKVSFFAFGMVVYRAFGTTTLKAEELILCELRGDRFYRS
jgi:hypothetical protein